MYSRASSQQNQFLYDAHQAIMRSYRSTADAALARRAYAAQVRQDAVPFTLNFGGLRARLDLDTTQITIIHQILY